MLMRHAAHAAAVAGFMGLIVSLASCGGYVKRDEFNGEVAKIREEMQTGDRQIAGRVDSTNQAVADHQRRLDALEQEFQAFRSEYRVSVEKVKGMLRFNVPVHFEFDRSELRESDHPVLDRFANVVKEYYPGALVTVEGFADPAGSQAYNLRLGRQRAEAVRDYLAAAGGLPPDGLRAVSYGEARNRQVVPGAKGPGDTGIENRRVTLVIDHAAVATDHVPMP
jgi:outer membrane protein OmpA-like peptidoglycan-associated protein